jgi:hypothetical protein
MRSPASRKSRKWRHVDRPIGEKLPQIRAKVTVRQAEMSGTCVQGRSLREIAPDSFA